MLDMRDIAQSMLSKIKKASPVRQNSPNDAFGHG